LSFPVNAEFKSHFMSADSNEKNRLLRVSELAQELGVSAQTVRAWERQGRIPPSVRSEGGHRMFSRTALEEASRLVTQSKRGVTEQKSPVAYPSNLAVDLASTGVRIKNLRIKAGLSQIEAAQLIGISRSFLSTVELGQSGISVQVLARMADVFGVTMSAFASSEEPWSKVIRANKRPRTVLAGGVTWYELASLGHDLEPTILEVPPGQNNGGVVTRVGENFIYVLTGELTFRHISPPDEVVLGPGDAILVEPGTAHTWSNNGASIMTCIWVEQMKTTKPQSVK
jgi:excisionase family DNA binding protein